MKFCRELARWAVANDTAYSSIHMALGYPEIFNTREKVILSRTMTFRSKSSSLFTYIILLKIHKCSCIFCNFQCFDFRSESDCSCNEPLLFARLLSVLSNFWSIPKGFSFSRDRYLNIEHYFQYLTMSFPIRSLSFNDLQSTYSQKSQLLHLSNSVCQWSMPKLWQFFWQPLLYIDLF